MVNSVSASSSSSSSSSTGSVHLRKTLGLHHGVSLIVGIIIGSGIFVSPTFVLQGTGSLGGALLVWLLGGVFCLFGALCFAELGTLVTLPGGVYGYIQAGLGDFAAFQFLWLSILVVYPAGNAVIALACARYLLQPFGACDTPDIAERVVAALVIALLTYVNCISIKAATRIQNFLTVIKTLSLVLVVLTGFVTLTKGNGSIRSLDELFSHSSRDVGGVMLSFYSGLFAYSGWYALNFLTEEMKNPYKNLPRAIWISLPLTTVIYVLSNVAYFVSLGRDGVLASSAVAFSLAEREFGLFSWAMPVMVGCSCFCTLNGFMLSVSRLFFVGAQNGHLPELMALVTIKSSIPLPAVVFEGVTSVLFLFGTDISVLINGSMFVEVLVFIVCTAVLLKFRWQLRGVDRPLKLHISIPLAFLAASVLFAVLPAVLCPGDIAIAFIAIVAGLPVYALGVMYKRKPATYREFMDNFTRGTQKCIMGVPVNGKMVAGL